MANHAQILTNVRMSPKKITEIINRLNKTLFKDLLKIEYSDNRGIPGAWGNDVWELEVINTIEGSPILYGERTCWLNSPYHFEMRHGGGSNFIWWIDSAIMNEIALEYNGAWTDDGYEGLTEVKEGKYNSFDEYLSRAFPSDMDDYINSEYVQMMIPPQFKWKSVNPVEPRGI